MYRRLLQYCLIIFLSGAAARAIQINYVRVPAAVRNASGRPALLDCDYSVRPGDSELVVKWFLDGRPVYQWIPPGRPQALGALAGRLDLEHRASGDARTAHRALRLLDPTSELAGEYRCLVSTVADEDSAAKRMTVYEPESSLMIWNSKPKEGSINFTCYGGQAYPAPKLTIYKDPKDNFNDRHPLSVVQWDTSKDRSGKYSAFVVASARVEDVLPGTLIHCELRLPGTGYVKRKTTLYYPPDMYKNKDAVIGGSCTPILLAIAIIKSV